MIKSFRRGARSSLAFALAFLEYSISKFVIKIKKDRHDLDGQQDGIVELNLFTNELIIGRKVPTNLSASTALGRPHQWPNYIIKKWIFQIYQFFVKTTCIICSIKLDSKWLIYEILKMKMVVKVGILTKICICYNVFYQWNWWY